MNAIAEIDKAGRIVVPKKLRDALHLVPGTRLRLHQQGETIVLQPETSHRGLAMKNGMPVYYTGRPIPPEAVDWIRQGYDERAEELMGKWPRK